jgi:tetratricopeptide (TPR) repeat protein/S1-C subfamily serine protease
MYRSSLFLTAALVGTTVTLIQPVASAKSASEVQPIARAVTVEINFKFKATDGEILDSRGSGVIIHRKGDIYTLVTNRHVVCGGVQCSQLPPVENYSLNLADGQRYQVKKSSIKFLGNNLDLAIIQFRSNRNYSVAKMSAPGSLKTQDKVYTAGFPADQSGFTLGDGEAIAVVNKRLIGDSGGYTVIHNAFTLPGMSGGGVFDSSGQLVAIHGQGDRFRENSEVDNNTRSRIGSKIGLNRGIPVRWLMQNLPRLGINLGGGSSTANIRAARAQVPETADEYFIAGFNKLVDPGDGDNVLPGKRLAVQNFSKAIQLNPKYEYAYFMRAIAYEQIKEFQKSLNDYNQITILNPKYSEAYYNRALLKADKLNDIDGALADYNQAILLNPKSATAYYSRANLKKDKLNDIDGALADYNQAILLNPKYSEAYNNRANLKYTKLNDIDGALADYNQAILLNPRDFKAYNNRAALKKDKLKDIDGALADYNQAILLNPKYSVAYYNRGVLKVVKLNDRAGAIQDFRQAARLSREEGNTKNYQLAIEALQKLGATE